MCHHHHVSDIKDIYESRHSIQYNKQVKGVPFLLIINVILHDQHDWKNIQVVTILRIDFHVSFFLSIKFAKAEALTLC